MFSVSNTDDIFRKYCTSINSLLIEITTKCNKNCSFCYNRYLRNSSINKEDIKRIIKFIKKYKIKNITLSGGEPLEFESIIELSKMLNNMGVKITIITNGLLLDRETVKLLSNNKSISIKISVDLKDYDFIPSLMQILKEYDVNYQLAITLYDVNREDIQQFITRTLSDYKGVYDMTFPIYKGNAKVDTKKIKNSVRLLEFLIDIAIDKGINMDCDHVTEAIFKYLQPNVSHSNNCDICRNIKVDIKGELYSCPYLTDEEFKIGNIDCLNVERSIMIAKKRIDLQNKPNCLACRWRNLCRGGCIACYENKTSDIDYNCMLYKAAYDYIQKRFGYY
jgi:Arylsulfatase regulator (Fe-S oxidoreductase)